MTIRSCRQPMAVMLMLSLAGCQSPDGVSSARVPSRFRHVVAKSQPDEAVDGLTESERIRNNWRKQNLASLNRADTRIGKTPLMTVAVDAQLQTTDEVPVVVAEQPANNFAFTPVESEYETAAAADPAVTEPPMPAISGVDDDEPPSRNEVATLQTKPAVHTSDVADVEDEPEPERAIPVILLSSVSEATSDELIKTASAEAMLPASQTAEALVSASEAFPVDLPTILRLAGGHNWAVQLAWERINQAEANVDAAEVLWVPSLNLGIAATKHEGQIQATNGQVVNVSRNSLFVGGGAKVANAPMTGGAGGPARLAVDLSIADAYFQPLVARQLSCAARSRHAAEFNNTQLEAALAYFDLIAAQGEVAATDLNVQDARDLLEMTEAFVAAGKASPAEVSRVQVILANQQQARINSELKLKLASSELIRIVRLDPSRLTSGALLYSGDDHLLAIELLPESCDLTSLILQGQRSRPEVAEQYALAEAQRADARSQELRPYIPHLNLGMSAGGFGGGVGSNVTGLDGRSDFDAMLVWQLRSLGLGEQAARRESTSRYRQAVLRAHQIQDQIAADVRNAWHRVDAGRQRMALARKNVDDASRVLQMNLDRIRGLEGLPLEAIQALNGVSTARVTLLQVIVDYNKAQASLLRAVGRPVSRAL